MAATRQSTTTQNSPYNAPKTVNPSPHPALICVDGWRAAVLIGAPAQSARTRRPIEAAHSRAGDRTRRSPSSVPAHSHTNELHAASSPWRRRPTRTAAAARRTRTASVAPTAPRTRIGTASAIRAPAPAKPARRPPRKTTLRTRRCPGARRRNVCATRRPPRPCRRRKRPSRTRWPSCPRWDAAARWAPTTHRGSAYPTRRTPKHTPKRASIPATV